jgi:periplasmic divalent cation tolerance protein
MIILGYIPCKNKEEAEAIAASLIEKNLVACANMVPATSMFHWEGKMNKEEETLLLVKTLSSRWEEAAVHIKKLHSYSCPCMGKMLLTVNKEYEAWVRERVQ